MRLDLQFFAGEKTEKATPKKRQDSRKKGQVAKSQDINTALLLFCMFLLFLVFGHFFGERFLNLFKYSYQQYLHLELTPSSVTHIFNEVAIETAITLAPILLISIIAGLAANYLQVGFLLSAEPLKFDLKKIDPIKGAKKIFSVRAIVELVKSLLKISFIGVVTFSVLWLRKDDMLMLSQKSPGIAISFLGETMVWMGLASSIILMILAVLDYMYQKYDFEKNIRMSKQDIRDEYKNIEGDPLIKSKIKERQRQMAMRRMMSEVPNADVVITNPTHYAIAIRYDEQKSDAPYVVAKGADYVAQKIKEIARHNQVVMVENRPLARALYDQLDIGQNIPEQFYQAVAEILAYVYRIQKKI
ncbi:flagellar biosynthesis protein FlhB [Bacillaceae bacterium S4-13-58]